MSYIDKLNDIRTILTNASPHVAMVTDDPSMVKPRNTSVTVWVTPPEIEWELWDEAKFTYKIFIVAGRSFDHIDAVNEILDTLDDFTHAHINMTYAHPATFQANGAGELAAYEVTCTFEF